MTSPSPPLHHESRRTNRDAAPHLYTFASRTQAPRCANPGEAGVLNHRTTRASLSKIAAFSRFVFSSLERLTTAHQPPHRDPLRTVNAARPLRHMPRRSQPRLSRGRRLKAPPGRDPTPRTRPVYTNFPQPGADPRACTSAHSNARRLPGAQATDSDDDRATPDKTRALYYIRYQRPRPRPSPRASRSSLPHWGGPVDGSNATRVGWCSMMVIDATR